MYYRRNWGASLPASQAMIPNPTAMPTLPSTVSVIPNLPIPAIQFDPSSGSGFDASAESIADQPLATTLEGLNAQLSAVEKAISDSNSKLANLSRQITLLKGEQIKVNTSNQRRQEIKAEIESLEAEKTTIVQSRIPLYTKRTQIKNAIAQAMSSNITPTLPTTPETSETTTSVPVLPENVTVVPSPVDLPTQPAPTTTTTPETTTVDPTLVSNGTTSVTTGFDFQSFYQQNKTLILLGGLAGLWYVFGRKKAPRKNPRRSKAKKRMTKRVKRTRSRRK